MSYSEVGTVYDPIGFKKHLDGLPALSWASSVTIHHTAYPDLAMRPKGFTVQHMRNLQSYYQNDKGWKAGPHLFTDDDEILGLSPLTSPGTHAKSFNGASIGIEMLGNYDEDDPSTGRGASVLWVSIQCTALLLAKLGLKATEETILFHRDDPKTSKTCPGTKIGKIWFVDEVRKEMEAHHSTPDPTPEPIDREDILERLNSIEWQTKQIRADLG